jgi:8-oxo-dGTP pyrophosphatase MutT (NUDIX family)
MLGEDYLEGARRELAEELGVTGNVELKELFDMQLRNDLESEDIRIFGLWIGGPFKFQREEIDEVRFWSAKALFEPGNQALFTPNLVRELDMLREKNYI